MPITLIDDFRFQQFTIQNNGGWCGGLSEWVYHYIIDEVDAGNPPAPEIAFRCIRDIMPFLQSSFDKLWGRERAHLPRYVADSRADIWQRQQKYEMGGGGPTGAWVKDFGASGAAYIQIWVTDTPLVRPAPGSEWAGFGQYPSTNHQGFVMWRNNVAFIFDPNVGGVLYVYHPFGSVPDFTAAMDEALDHAYPRYDRLRGRRFARVRTATAPT